MFDLSAEQLRSALDYKRDTGQFFWKSEARVGIKKSVIAHRAGDEAGTARKSDGRVVIRIFGRLYLRYRLAWLWTHGAWPVGEIDHRDGDKSNDRIGNLREATRRLNQQNIRKPLASKRSSGHLGVHANKPGRSKPWRACITDNGKQMTIGYFMTEEEAATAYLSEKRKIHQGCTI